MPGDLYNEIDYSDAGSTKSRPPLRRAPDRPDHVKRVHAAFGFIGLVVSIAIAVYAHNETSSVALPIFVLIVVQTYIARGLGDVATDPHKVKRFVYFSLLPVSSFALLWLTYRWWGLMWLSAILGFLGGMIVWGLLASLFFLDIQGEEMEDTEKRKKTGGL